MDALLHSGVAPRRLGQVQALVAMRTAHADGALLFVLEIARRWGKTHMLCVWALMLAMAREGARVPYAASTRESLREYVLPILADLIAEAPDELRPVIVGHEVRIRLPGWTRDSRIVLAGCEDRHKADALRGPKADGAIVDEAGYIPVLRYVVEDVLSYQLATTGGLMVLASSTPTSPDHPFCELATRAQERGHYQRATIYDTPFVAPEMIHRLCVAAGGPTSVSWRREALAERIVDPTLSIVPEWTEGHAVELASPPHVDRYAVGDLGYVDLSVILLAEWHFLDALVYVVDEVVVERATSHEVQRQVSERERERWGEATVHKRVVDAPAITRADLVRLQGPGEPASRWQAARTDDLEAAVNALREAVRRRQLLVHPRCRTLVAHLAGGVWNARRTSFERSAGLGHFDGIAAAMYLVRHVDRTRNPSPPVPYDRYTQWQHPDHRVPQDELARRKQRWDRAIGGGRERR